MATTCFQNRLLIRPDDFRLQAAGAGIEPTSRRSERPVLPLNDPASVFFANTHRPRQVCRQGSGGRNRTCDLVVQSHASRTNSDDPGMLPAVRVPCGNRSAPVQLGRLVPEPIGQGHVLSRRKERESNPQGSNARPASNALAIANWLALPYHQGCGGRNRTCVRAVNSRLPVPARAPPHRVVQSGRPVMDIS